MEHFSASEAIEQAVQAERLGYAFYSQMSERFKEDKGLKELFDDLALKEQGHEKKFASLKDIVRDEKNVDWYEVSKYLRAIVESEFFLGKDKSLPSLEHVKTVADAVRVAIGFEKETLLYFYAMRDVVSEKGVVGSIIEEEKSHVVTLRRFEESLKK
jgi:rubrerythrin